VAALFTNAITWARPEQMEHARDASAGIVEQDHRTSNLRSRQDVSSQLTKFAEVC
jgi:hypothetical protein